MIKSAMAKNTLFQTTVVGSMPRTLFVVDLLRPDTIKQIGEKAAQDEMDSAIKFMIAMMENTGIDIITDGEWRRVSYTGIVSQMLDGFVDGTELKSGKDPDPRPSDWGAAGHQFVVERMHNHRHLIAKEAAFVKANTKRRVKICLPSPFILGQRMWHPEQSVIAYPTRRDFVKATVPILRAELEAIQEIGVDIVQIDEPHLSSFSDPKARKDFDDPDTDLDFLVECLNDVVSGFDQITFAVHVCRFNRGRAGTSNYGGYAPIIPALNKLKVDQFTLEFAIPEAGDMEILGLLREDVDIAVGCVDCRSAKIDSPNQIVKRIERAMKFLPKERILLTPDCGFGPGAGMKITQNSIPLDEAYTKLKNEAAAAHILRERYG